MKDLINCVIIHMFFVLFFFLHLTQNVFSCFQFTYVCTDARLKFINCYIEGNIGKATWGLAMERRQLPVEHTITGGYSSTELVVNNLYCA